MAKILFVIMPTKGHQNPALKLARRLEERGHQVAFVGSPGDGAYLREQGMTYHPILAELLPEGFAAAPKQLGRGLGFIPRFRAFIKQVGETLCRDFEGLMDEHQPDLFVVDIMLSCVAMLPQRRRIPAVLLSPVFPLNREPGIPLPFSSRLPAQGWAERLRARLAWSCNLTLQGAAFRLFGFEGLFRQLAAFADFDQKGIRRDMLFTHDVAVPKLITCPECLDFPRRPDPMRHYIEPSVDSARAEVDFPWSRLDSNKKLVYCGGTTMTSSARVRQYFGNVLEAFEDDPEYQVVITTGGNRHGKHLLERETSGVVVAFAPQTALLQKTSVALTHAGLNTIQDCIYYGVPMLAFPFGKEQPGNAARIAWHGLGKVGDIRQATPADIRAKVHELDKDAQVRANLKAMSETFKATDQQAPGVSLIESLIETRDMVGISA